MQNFLYKARDNFGKEVRGTMMADGEAELANKISNLGYYLVRYKEISEAQQLKGSKKVARLKTPDLLNFTIHLATLIDSGVPLAAALRELAQDETKENLQKIIDDVRYRVEAGSSLKEALASSPRSFPKLYTAIVGAGESTGKLPVCLNELARLIDWQLELGAKVREAATYPVILFCVMLGVVTLLMVKMIPTFKPIFKEMNIQLPGPTQFVLNVSDFVLNWWWMILGAAVLLVAGYIAYNATAGGRYRIDSVKLRLPVLGGLLRKIALSRFCHTFALGLKSGVNILTALDLASEVVDNVRIRRSVVKARDSVNVGEKLGTAFQVSGEFPPLVVRMITVGEQSGSLPQTLDKVTIFYDREVPSAIRKMFSLFEPVTIVFMAAVVGGIAVAIFLPMFKIADVIGGG
ncbi:type II secretion system F family protein [bacterium]|nr:MAG: type II secretion system F family protein [bacterium]